MDLNCEYVKMKAINSADYERITEEYKSNLSYPKIDALAGKIAQENNFDPMRDFVRYLAIKLGASIIVTDSNTHLQGSLEGGSVFIDGPKKFTIFLPEFTGVLRDNFTIGHELGHYFLHSNKGEHKVFATRFGSEPIEWQANRFAAGLLMPAKRFLRVAKKSNNSISVLAGSFNVSSKAAEARLDSLSR